MTGKNNKQAFVGLYEIAEMGGVSSSAVSNWRVRFADFPSPVVQLRSGPVFAKDEVGDWLIKHEREMTTTQDATNTENVALLCDAIASEMGLPEGTRQTVKLAAILRGVGKISIPFDLNKAGDLDEHELNLIKGHCLAGYEILEKAGLPYPIGEIVYQHHERMDGSGYPRGLKGDQILLEARIVAVADVVEAMTHRRPNRPALGIEKALETITKERGTKFDAGVVDVCLRLFREKSFKLS
jgi:HD-GYP domain-containing protein (c-di-GMP phosphodiesterase class II)